MGRKWIWLLVGWLVIVGAVGCGQVTSSLPVESNAPLVETVEADALLVVSPTQVIQEGTMEISPTIPSPSDSALQGLVTQAKQDLAQRFAIGVEQIGLVEAKAVVWPDASLGCPQPGMMYAQMTKSGYRIVLEADGQVREYHADLDQVVLCESASLPGVPPKGGDAAVDDGWPNQPIGDDVIIVPPSERK